MGRVFSIIAAIGLSSYLFAQESFMSKYEYGQMLYHQPRGVSCAACHGERGEGKIIATYMEIQKDKTKVKKVLKGSDIRQISLEKLTKALNTGPSVMPKYFLADEEIRAIHFYLNAQK